MQSSLLRVGIGGSQRLRPGHNRGRLDSDRRRGRRGRVIPHASDLPAPASAAFALAIAVVEPAFRAPAMTAAGAPQALRARLGRAARVAIDMAAVAASANREDGLTTRASRQSQRRRQGIHGLRSVPTRSRPPTLPDRQERATIRVGRACVPSKTGARPLEDSEPLLRVLTCF